MDCRAIERADTILYIASRLWGLPWAETLTVTHVIADMLWSHILETAVVSDACIIEVIRR